jgi:hypothetical protein
MITLCVLSLCGRALVNIHPEGSAETDRRTRARSLDHSATLRRSAAVTGPTRPTRSPGSSTPTIVTLNRHCDTAVQVDESFDKRYHLHVGVLVDGDSAAAVTNDLENIARHAADLGYPIGSPEVHG